MSSVQLVTTLATVPQAQVLPEEPWWYAIQVRCQFEKKASQQLQEKGVEAFVPTLKQRRRWSDRWQVVEFPTFPGYAFVHLHPSPVRRLQVLQTRGVFSFVAFGGELIPIPDKQIEDLQLVCAAGVPYSVYRHLDVGMRVRIRGGCLDGLQGVLVSRRSEKVLVISIAPIQRSIAVALDNYDVEAI